MGNGDINNVESFIKKIEGLIRNKTDIVFYRGQSDVDYKLKPYILREDNFKDNECEIYNEIMTECSHEFNDCKLHNEILSKMQHYGVPTRLLDVTTNALVALFFACTKHEDTDGVVYVIRDKNLKLKRYDSDAISILSALPRFRKQEKDEIKKLAEKHSKNNNIKDFNRRPIIKRLLHEIKKEKPAFENIIKPRDLIENYCFIPRKINARIIRQSGAFIIFGLGIEEIEIDDKDKIIIEKDKKKSIITQLSYLGITEASLHPELYKVSEHIKSKYLI